MVQNYSLGGTPSSPMNWSVSTSTNGYLKWLKLHATIQNNMTGTSFDVYITFFVSSICGTVKYGNTTIHPRSLESVFEVRGYEYQNDTNHLTLTFAVAHSNSSFFLSRDKVGTGHDDEDDVDEVFVKLSDNCWARHGGNSLFGDIRSVFVKFWRRAFDLFDLFTWMGLRDFLFRKFGNNWDFQITEIDFPDNATDIIYDPTLATGTRVAAVASSDAPTSLFTPTTASSIVSLFMVIVGVYAVLI